MPLRSFYVQVRTRFQFAKTSVQSITELCTSCTDLFTQNLSMNEKLVVLKIVDFLSINYVIVLSSVLFGYGTFICINTIDIIL